MASVVVFSLFVALLGFSVAQPPFYVDAPQNSCCFGRGRYFANGQTVLSLPKCCASLECRAGDIVPRYFGPPDSKDCCVFDGQMYPSGSQLTSYCVPLVCVRGNWTYSSKIEECCKMCKIYNDPHFTTYDGYLYHWHGLCNYTITQTGRSHHPQIGVFSDFQPCFSGASCLHITTFRNDDNTLLSLTHSILPASMTTVHVLGDTASSIFLVPPVGVHHVQSVSGDHPVLAWRDGDCIMLMGSSRITVRYCHGHLTVWAYPTHANHLDGLCGHFNFYLNDDMTNRDGTVHTPNPWPVAFPESWKTIKQTDRVCLTPCYNCKETTEDPCRATPQAMGRLRHRCAKELNVIIGRDEKLVPHVDTCAWDVCMAAQAQQSLAEQQRWIDDAKTIVRDVKMMGNRASGTWEPRSPPSSGACSPGSRWKRECYWCTCGTDASADCETKLCPDDYEHETGTDACTDGSWWKNDQCNWCECAQGGHVCSNKDCTGIKTQPTVSKPPTEEVCLFSPDTGSCEQFMYRYYYSYKEGRCLIFGYSGCEGNANNFHTVEECERTCGHLTPPPSVFTTSSTRAPDDLRPAYCNLQPEKGPCEAIKLRYFYNSTTKACEPFTYGGCDGNGNNFIYKKDCEEACLVPITATIEPVTQPAQCSLSLSVGDCTNRMTRYYYIPAIRSCVPFTYTGCGGNENNFLTKEYCEAVCLGITAAPSTHPTQYTTTTPSPIPGTSQTGLPAHCFLPPDAGHCQNTTIRYYYDPLTRMCRSFSYNGCGGNLNNFLNEEWCSASCQGSVPATKVTTEVTTKVTTDAAKPPALCYQDFEIGTCFETLWRWYYDQTRRSCQPFMYGGCYGNDNNFESKEECEAVCGGQTEST
ncbi:mucin-2-like isoform X2 [Scylla paramamosain]|uniref:mucin-2-like isoform X2 n=1 Tax=Scylla paramamosain TaxID=85552 RepID=UPI003083578B